MSRWGNSLFYYSEGTVWSLTIIGLAGYILKGASDPNTAGHMHVIVFPLLIFILVLALLVATWAIVLLRSRITAP